MPSGVRALRQRCLGFTSEFSLEFRSAYNPLHSLTERERARERARARERERPEKRRQSHRQ